MGIMSQQWTRGVTSLGYEGGTADVKLSSQHLSGMVEENHRNPVGSDSNVGLLRYEKLCKTHHCTVHERQKAIVMII
jgi:hypothetical protein